MEPVLDFFFWTVWSSEALAAVASASTPDEVRTAWRGCGGGYDSGVAERSKRKAGGAARLRAAPVPGPAAPGMAGHVPLSGSVPEGPSAAWRRTCRRGGCTRTDAATPRDARSVSGGSFFSGVCAVSPRVRRLGGLRRPWGRRGSPRGAAPWPRGVSAVVDAQFLQ